jgi:hypothetical protein
MAAMATTPTPTTPTIVVVAVCDRWANQFVVVGSSSAGRCCV